jgi:hypothetical protein
MKVAQLEKTQPIAGVAFSITFIDRDQPILNGHQPITNVAGNAKATQDRGSASCCNSGDAESQLKRAAVEARGSDWMMCAK